MCAYGLKIDRTRNLETGETGLLSKKPIAVLTNVPELAEYLNKRCDGTHKHGALLGGTAEAAARYSPQFVSAILKGIRAHMKTKGLWRGFPSRQQRHFEDWSSEVNQTGQNLG